MEISSYISQIIARLPLWAILSVPLFLVQWGLYSFLKQSELGKYIKLFILSTIGVILLTPMPSGMYLALLPNGYLMFGGVRYYNEVWVWFIVSSSVTFVILCLLYYTLLTHNKSLNLTGADNAPPS